MSAHMETGSTWGIRKKIEALGFNQIVREIEKKEMWHEKIYISPNTTPTGKHERPNGFLKMTEVGLESQIRNEPGD